METVNSERESQLMFNIFHYVSTKPMFAGVTGVLAGLGTYLGYLTPIIGFIAALIALAGAIYGLIHKINVVKEDIYNLDKHKNRNKR